MLRLRDVRVGLKTLLMHPLRSMLTVLGIFIGVASVIWLLAISEGIADKANRQIEELGANNLILTTSRPSGDQVQGKKVYYYGLTEEDCVHLTGENIPTISDAIPLYRRTGREFRYLDRMVVGEINACTPRYKEIYRLEMARGRFLDRPRSRKPCECLRPGSTKSRGNCFGTRTRSASRFTSSTTISRWSV